MTVPSRDKTEVSLAGGNISNDALLLAQYSELPFSSIIRTAVYSTSLFSGWLCVTQVRTNNKTDIIDRCRFQ